MNKSAYYLLCKVLWIHRKYFTAYFFVRLVRILYGFKRKYMFNIIKQTRMCGINDSMLVNIHDVDINIVSSNPPVTPPVTPPILQTDLLDNTNPKLKNFYCYILFDNNDRTYNGYTVDLKRRLRQHNGALVGGARATKKGGPWEFLAILTSPCWDCISTAMQHEWSIKYPTRKRPRPKAFNGAKGRLNSLEDVFKHMQTLNCEKVSCFVHERFYQEYVERFMRFTFVTIHKMDHMFSVK
jgi:predicted GIY-YIG superfamily endonuclease